MANTGYKSVDEYMDSQPAGARGVLESVRRIIRRALPRAEETISYQIPAYKLDRRTVIYFAGWKKHFSIYPATEAVVAAFRSELSRYELSKGTIRFPLGEPVPGKLIAQIAKLRVKEAAAVETRKPGAKKTRRSAAGR